MSMAYLAQPEQQQQLEWLDGGTLATLLDGPATMGNLMIDRFDVSEGEAPPYHKHTKARTRSSCSLAATAGSCLTGGMLLLKNISRLLHHLSAKWTY